MTRQHTFTANIEWTGNLGTGTSAYTEYSRNQTLSAKGKAPLACSPAPEFSGGACRSFAILFMPLVNSTQNHSTTSTSNKSWTAQIWAFHSNPANEHHPLFKTTIA